MTANFTEDFKTVRIFQMTANFPDDFKTVRIFPNADGIPPMLLIFNLRGFAHFVWKLFARRKLLPGKFWVFPPLHDSKLELIEKHLSCR